MYFHQFALILGCDFTKPFHYMKNDLFKSETSIVMTGTKNIKSM